MVTALQSLGFKCRCCGKLIPHDWLRGELVGYNDHSASLDGYALCEPCRLVMPIAARIRDDGTLLVRSEGHVWKTMRYSKPRWGSMILERLLAMFPGKGGLR